MLVTSAGATAIRTTLRRLHGAGEVSEMPIPAQPRPTTSAWLLLADSMSAPLLGAPQPDRHPVGLRKRGVVERVADNGWQLKG